MLNTLFAMNALANGDSGNSKPTDNNKKKKPAEDEISDRLLHVPPGHHTVHTVACTISVTLKICLLKRNQIP